MTPGWFARDCAARRAVTWAALSFALCGTLTAQAGGEAALRAGEYEKAVEELAAAHRQAPADRGVLELYAEALLETGAYRDAVAELGRDLDERPADRRTRIGLLLARAQLRLGEWQAAEALLRELAARDDAIGAEARSELGELLFRSGRVAESERILDSLIDYYNARDRLGARELVAVGRAVRRLGRSDPQLFKDALKAFDEAVAADPLDPLPRVLSAELFLEKYDSRQALESLGPVLERNPNHPEALLALARVRKFDGSGAARELVEKALETNPNLVAAKVLRAQILLEVEQDAEAQEVARSALGVDPRSLEALSVLAAAHFLAGEHEQFAATEAAVLELNPSWADLYNTLAEACVQNRLYEQARDFAQRAVEIDPKSWRGWGELGLNRLRLGAIDSGREALERAFAGDPYNVWNKNTLDLLDKFAEFRTIPYGRFELFIHRDEAELLAEYVGSLAEEAYTYLAQRYHHEPPTPIRIEVYPSHADFSVRTVGLAGLGALGVSFGPVIAIDSPSARTIGSFNWGTTLWHEITHTFTLGVTEHQIPRWLTEGLSVFEERAGRTAWGDDVRPEFLQAYRDGRLLGLGEINDGFVRPTYPGQIGLSYYQGSLICEWIDREWSFDKILEILNGYRQRLPTETIFRNALGLELEEVDRRFFAYLDERFASVLPSFEPQPQTPHATLALGAEQPPEPAAPPAPPSAEDLERWARDEPTNFRAQLAWGSRLVEEGRGEEAIEFLERAQKIFPEYALEGSPYDLLAEIHRQAGRSQAAIRELDAMTSINEYAYDALIELAGLYREADEPEREADVLARSLYVYPLEVEPHRRLAGLYEEMERFRAAATEWQALAALAPASRAEAFYRRALALHRAGDRADARRSLLRALELAPGYEKAQELLLELAGETSS